MGWRRSMREKQPLLVLVARAAYGKVVAPIHLDVGAGGD